MPDVPDKPLSPPERIERAFHTACWLTNQVGSPLNSGQAARLLNRHGLHTVVGGWSVASCWGGRPSGMLDMTLMTPDPARAHRILRGERLRLLTLANSTSNRFWRQACAAAMKIRWKRTSIDILTPEYSLVSCWRGMINRRSEYVDRLQSAAYFACVATNCQEILCERTIRIAANAVRSGGGEDVMKQVAAAQAQQRLSF